MRFRSEEYIFAANVLRVLNHKFQLIVVKHQSIIGYEVISANEALLHQMIYFASTVTESYADLLIKQLLHVLSVLMVGIVANAKWNSAEMSR